MGCLVGVAGVKLRVSIDRSPPSLIQPFYFVGYQWVAQELQRQRLDRSAIALRKNPIKCPVASWAVTFPFAVRRHHDRDAERSIFGTAGLPPSGACAGHLVEN